MNRVLILSSHADDAELAAGGTIKRLVEEGHTVRHIVFSDCLNVEIIAEFQHSQQVLGISDYHVYRYDFRRFNENRQDILDCLVKHKKDYNPTHVITHGSKDTNQDHKVIFEESFRAFKTCNLLGYNHPWNQREAKADYFVRLERKHLDSKIEALSQYHSQKDRLYFNPEYTEAQALSHGTMLQCGYAEAFETLNILY